MKIHLVCAARPNFMKVAPLYHALKAEQWAEPVIVHTGQHYDPNMSDSFFSDLGLPKPDIYLDIKSGSHAEQTGRVMIAYEKVLTSSPPDLVVVVGDVNSTMAATITSTKLGIKVAHLEAGLRSGDRRMPEEINRLVTDVLADFLWTPSQDGSDNLLREGIAPEKIQLVGNIMIDSLEMQRVKIEKQATRKEFNLNKQEYAVVTLHRPSNVDDRHTLSEISEMLIDLGGTIPTIFPVHPRTKKNLEKNNLYDNLKNTKGLFLPEPLNYIRFMSLVFDSRIVITDSGGLQEETSYLGIPCLTVRENTERPITITQGTNQLCQLKDVIRKVKIILDSETKPSERIKFWDGRTAKRIVDAIAGMNDKPSNRLVNL